MKTVAIRTIQMLALLLALAIPALAEESKRGFFEGDLAGGGKIVFFVQGNHAISAYVFDTGGHQSGFAGGGAGNDGKFTLKTSNQQTITGTIGTNSITATYLNQTITANLKPTFGPTDSVAGRYSAPAQSSAGNIETKILIDSQGNIFLTGKHGQNTIGGFGTITITSNPSPSRSPSASPSGTPSATPTATASPTASATATASASPSPSPSATATASPTATPGDDDEDDDHDEDDDDAQDSHEDQNAPAITATFTVTLVTGETITGNLTFRHGVVLGSFTWNGTVYTIRASKESSFNHLANIATRGFVNTGQGQLIGGFIITGGPKMVLIRALGPSLTAFGVSPVLADPKLQLFAQGGALLRENDNWQSASNASDITATTIPPTDPKESAILIRLEPGSYTTVVTGADGGTGIALVEVYEIDRD
jgi:hypothetical protein